MKNKLNNYVRRLFMAGTAVFSLFAAGFILYDIYVSGLNTAAPRTLSYLAVALIFLFITMLIFANDLYRKTK